ncbi:hypothetical protein SAMN00017405_1457 [Desulfonispora thiosulfatigenes DSM 11270]|uniref:Lipoprotein n=1 Tax=Desulfonispora thiosulfatigenes DSM 11270 TaxID=656914 RepID=A0A1W1VTA5_DESTI|nr:hypothetical protein [Desulfonispora thiosulfatigenes]SMB96114.1 hypothetical protein SAMN00017405_1457 [Desulfonispora thiosulfatigenes DSM 11270]
MMRIKFKLVVLALCTIFLLLQITGCSKAPEKSPAKDKKGASEQENAPKELEDIQTNIEEIITDIEKKNEFAQDPQKDQTENQKDSSNEQKKSGDDKAQEKQPKSKENPLTNWQKEEKSARDIHLKWNTAETSVVKVDITNTLRNEFENNLNFLTDNIISKNINESLKSANELYGTTIKINELYKNNDVPRVEILKYYTKRALLEVEESKWPEAKEDIKKLATEVEKVNLIMDKKENKLLLQLDYSVHDFLQAVEINNKEVAKIKGEIVMKNINSVIKKIAKE